MSLYAIGDFALFMVRVMLPILILVGLFMPSSFDDEEDPLPITQTLIIEGRL